MRHAVHTALWLMIVLLVAACSPSAPAVVTFKDPFRYCAAIGTIDAPDARYTGPKVPLVVARGLQAAFGVPADAPLEPFLRNTYWRCMDGEVYACNIGANLPCLEKANTSQVPSAAMAQYCRENPSAAIIPAYVTGRATVYEWKCRQGTPAIVRQITRPDPAGFLANIWYRIPEPTRSG